jgi:hypothetical protein
MARSATAMSAVGHSRRFWHVGVMSGFEVPAQGISLDIHTVVHSNGLPVQLARTPGEAHHNRL